MAGLRGPGGPAKPRQAGLAAWPAGIWDLFFQFFFGPQNGLKLSPRALGRPGDYFWLIFGLFLAIFGALGALGPPRALGPYFFLLKFPPILPLSGAFFT